MTTEEHKRRLRAMRNARKEMEDALLVMAHLETAQSNLPKRLSERTVAMEEQRDRQRKLNAEIDQRIASLVSAIGGFISKQSRV